MIGVVLSGNRNDGTAGLRSIKQHGGIAVVQAPEDALFADMPRSAIENVAVDHVVPVAQIGRLLVNLVQQHQQSERKITVPDETDSGAEQLVQCDTATF